jgi:hypothetical protein
MRIAPGSAGQFETVPRRGPGVDIDPADAAALGGEGQRADPGSVAGEDLLEQFRMVVLLTDLADDDVHLRVGAVSEKR